METLNSSDLLRNDWIGERHLSINYREINNKNKSLKTVSSKDATYLRNNVGREKQEELLA